MTQTTQTTPATPRKLRSGEWGVAIQESHPKGTVLDVAVTAKSGKTWTDTVRVIWGNDSFSLAASMRDEERAYRAAHSRGRWHNDGFSQRCAGHDHDAYIDSGLQCPGCGSHN